MPPRDPGSADPSEPITDSVFEQEDGKGPGPPDHLRFADILALNRGAWLCAAMLSDWYGVPGLVTVPSPPAELDDEDLTQFRERLVEFMPKDSLIYGMLDLDTKIWDLLGDDWFFTAVFGAPSTLAPCADELSERFMSKVDEYGLDLGVVGVDEERELIGDAATDFVHRWRHQTIRRFLPGSSASLMPSGY